MESMILFKRNQTAKWLKSKSNEEKKKMFTACIKLGRQQRKLYKERELEIRDYRMNVIKKKEEEIMRRKEEVKKKKESLCFKISKDGFWDSKEEIYTKIAAKSETKKRTLLQTQLRFRQFVLKQPYPDKTIFSFSKAKKKLSSDQLMSNLCELIDSSPRVEVADILSMPNSWIGKQIKHRFVDEQDSTTTWYHGLVVGAPEPQLFEVIYFGEEIYEFDLLQDYNDGDLELLL